MPLDRLHGRLDVINALILFCLEDKSQEGVCQTIMTTTDKLERKDRSRGIRMDSRQVVSS